MGSQLGSSPADFLLAAVSEFTFTRTFSATGTGLVGVGGTTPLLGRLGVRARAHDLGLALSPYVQLELTGGGLMRVLGSRLRYMGARMAVGVEYFATADVSLGVTLGITVGGTLGERPAFYGLADGIVYASFALNKGMGDAATTGEAAAPPASTLLPRLGAIPGASPNP